MSIKLSTKAGEESTYILDITLVDEGGKTIKDAAVTSLKWSMTDANGATINDRKDETMTPAGKFNIVLSGDDLATTKDDEYRYVVIEATYNSTTYGNGLPLVEECQFTIDNYKAKS